MAPTPGRRRKAPQSRNNARLLKRKRETEDVETLEKAVADLNPKEAEIKTFSDLPLAQPTASGLNASHFKMMTDVQTKAIPLALKGADCLGAAKTGSGKTLAFLVPVLDNLFRRRWTELDGLGALIISPTRELAIQIFEVLRKVGRYHTFSAGLVIGGKSLREERERLARMNILVCTPGRMLQHMDQTAAFDVGNLQMLVLDEADRIMDMGFQTTVDAIVGHLPKDRQTLLFSATQTKRVSDLARLSLRDPEYVAVHEAAASATPSTLQQHYVVTPLPEKLNTLFSFIRSNVKAKILVFLSSGKQVRFVYESFRHLQPGIPLLHLHGRQKQTARLDITSNFSASKNACLFATDVVARGLDFPAVDWVLQVDCPEDAETYIHRVGRTARYERNGRAVLFLDPSEEEGMIRRLEHKKVPIEKINVRQKKQQSIQNQLQNMCFKDAELKYLGQKAFISYARSIHVQKDKEIFKVDRLPLQQFSESLGLPGAPRIKFLQGDNAKQLKNAPRQAMVSSDDEDDETEPKRKDGVRTKYDRMFERRNQDVLADHYSRIKGHDDPQGADADEDDEFMTVKRHLDMAGREESHSHGEDQEKVYASKHKVIPSIGNDALVIDSKRREKLLKSKKKLLKLKGRGTKLVYDENGEAHPVHDLENEEDFKQRGDAESQRNQFLANEKKRVRTADLTDKQLAKEKKRQKRERTKAREMAEHEDGESGDGRADLEPLDGDDAAVAGVPVMSEGLGADDEDGPSRKRPKKWFEDDSDDEKQEARHVGQSMQVPDEPETLEDLEALASGLLG